MLPTATTETEYHPVEAPLTRMDSLLADAIIEALGELERDAELRVVPRNVVHIVRASRLIRRRTSKREAPVEHRRAKLSIEGRRLLIERIRFADWPVALANPAGPPVTQQRAICDVNRRELGTRIGLSRLLRVRRRPTFRFGNAAI
jgi:hypothetical protein